MVLPMHEQINHSSVARELDLAERAALDMLLTCDGPGLWSVAELARALGSEVLAADAVAGLSAAGLVHRHGEFVFATRAAVRSLALAEAV
jgi:hypothetical protein